MLKGENIIYFGPGKWDGMWRNRHQLMSRFARCNKVMYVEPNIYLKSLRYQLRQGELSSNDFYQAIRQQRVTKTATDVYIYKSPIFAPISGRFPLDKITWWVWKSLLMSTMKRLGFHKPIIWLSQPHMDHFVGSFREKLSIYHVVDEYLAYGDMNTEERTRIEILEKKMLKKADLVIVVSDKLLESKGPFNKHTYIVPNGVDYESYDQALRSSESQPLDMAKLPKPIIGYSGLISSRLDLSLLEHAAEAHPEWSLVLIGGTNKDWSNSSYQQLQKMGNVHFLGFKEIGRIPYYVKAFDVCVIPYGTNKQSHNLSPLKLYDFLAMGKPIVTTDFPAAREFQHVIRIADSKDSFIQMIECSLKENDYGLFARRRQIASQNTWEHRVYQLSEIIQSHLPKFPRNTAIE